MSLSILIKKGGLAKIATVTTATNATQGQKQTGTVAPVACVAVVHKSIRPSELSSAEESSIREWLAYIEETDLTTINGILDKCRTDSEARRYCLQQAEEVPSTFICSKRVVCGDCLHFERIDHPRLGHCAKGEPEAIAALWDSDRRYCDKFLACLK